MLRGFIIVCAIWLASVGSVFAAVNEDVRCVQAFLATTAFDPGPIDGALGKKTVKAAADFAARASVADKLPILSVETAGQWCQYAQSGDATTAAVVASLTLYPVSIKALSELDDGTGLIPFDFRSVAVTSKYDRTACSFVLNRIFRGEHQRIAQGELVITNGHIQFTKAAWLTRGLSTPEAFQRANLALTEDGKIVGKLPVFFIFVNPGDVPRRALIASLGKSDDRFAGTDPTGAVGFELSPDMSGELMIRTCRDAGGNYTKYAYDFSPHELSTAFDGKVCKLEIRRRLKEDNSVQVIGSAEAEIVGGRLNLSRGVWRTGGGEDSFLLANLGITTSGQMVGVWDTYPVFPNDERPLSEANTVEMATSEGAVGDDLSQTVTFAFPLENFMTGEVSFRTCEDEAGTFAKYAYDFSPYELSSEHDGKECLLEIRRNVISEDRVEIIGTATANFKDGHLSLSKGGWRTGGTPDTFELANLAITSKGKIVGTWDVYPQFKDANNPRPFSDTVQMEKSKGAIGANLEGEVTFAFPMRDQISGELAIKTCKGAEGQYVKFAFDFSPYKLSSDFDGQKCKVSVSRILLDDGNKVQAIGGGLATVTDGRLTFVSGYWNTRGPMESFFLANLGITEDRGLVGVWDVYPMFPDNRAPVPQSSTILMAKSKDRLGDDLSETVSFAIPEERMARGQVQLACEKPS